MTFMEARVKYADKNGYVSCEGCPLSPGGSELCMKYRPGACRGFDDALAAIVNYFTEHPENPQKVIEMVNHPSHYNQGGIECIDAMVAAFGKEAVENFCICNAFKYVWRNRDKNGFEDIDKAIWYLEKIKELCSDE